MGSTLVEALGYGADQTLAIVNCDDLGSSHAANVATADALEAGTATSATLMVPCRWSREAAEMCRGHDIGIHLTLNCETESERWGPLTGGPSLVDPEGMLPRTIEEVWENADPAEVLDECRAQIDRALEWGLDVTHLDSHVGHMIQRTPALFDVYTELADEYRLPVRLTGAGTEEFIGFPFRHLAAARGVVGPDELVVVREGNGVGSRRTLLKVLPRLGPGVFEMYLHPAVDCGEIRTLTPDWAARVDDHRFLTGETTFRDALDAAGVTIVSYRPLREHLRRHRPGAASGTRPGG
jgi:predicted glycoside hydrolase/deacetylase ChbG (UPF0249 family)